MKDLYNLDNDYIRVIDFSHYDTANRQNMWTVECKTCGKEFLMKSGDSDRRKSCGCMNGKSGGRVMAIETLHTTNTNMLRQKWL